MSMMYFGMADTKKYDVKEWATHFVYSVIGQAIGPLWDFCAPISIIVEL